MTARKCFIAAAGLMTASAAHAEDIPSNAELFRMLKAQQQTISGAARRIEAGETGAAHGHSERGPRGCTGRPSRPDATP